MGTTSILSLGPDAQRQVRQQLAGTPASQDEPRAKFGNAAQVVDGYRFASKREAARYMALKAEQAAGGISDLRVQPAWRLEVQGVFICDYVADFCYMRAGALIVEDVKSKATRTPAYLIKRKLMRAVHRIAVREVA